MREERCRVVPSYDELVKTSGYPSRSTSVRHTVCTVPFACTRLLPKSALVLASFQLCTMRFRLIVLELLLPLVTLTVSDAERPRPSKVSGSLASVDVRTQVA